MHRHPLPAARLALLPVAPHAPATCLSCPPPLARHAALPPPAPHRCVATELDARPSGLSRRDVKLLSWQLASVIRYLHACRVVHRDVKPANILLTDEGVLKLCE